MTEDDPKVIPPAREPDWVHIARVYQGEEPLEKIAGHYGLSVQKISAHAQAQGWPLRKYRNARTESATGQKRQDLAALMHRLTGLVERQIKEIETRLCEAGEARDQERDARTLSNLTRTLDKLVELNRGAEDDRAAKAQRARETAKRKGSKADGEAMRAHLARRLSRLAAQANSSRVSG